jgi:predicted SAM-dependent methyltransferase
MSMFSKSKPATGAPAGAPRLHIGSGDKRLEGWVNIDLKPLPGVDVVADVTQGLDFTGAEAVFAEHFLEHLAIDDAIGFLLECHRVLGDGGWLRLSTPNLDWVWSTHYRLDAPAADKRAMATHMNRAFHGWGHRFLWNREMLGEALEACGFDSVRWCRYGESELPIFQGLERHETYGDEPGLAHVLIGEGRKAAPQPERLAALRRQLTDEFLNHLAG